eukprot:Sspe_Gene.19075::Locus_6919_Transcript_2_2_Confidence_0.667_Length_3572::g.19075::m.19075
MPLGGGIPRPLNEVVSTPLGSPSVPSPGVPSNGTSPLSQYNSRRPVNESFSPLRRPILSPQLLSMDVIRPGKASGSPKKPALPRGVPPDGHGAAVGSLPGKHSAPPQSPPRHTAFSLPLDSVAIAKVASSVSPPRASDAVHRPSYSYAVGVTTEGRGTDSCNPALARHTAALLASTVEQLRDRRSSASPDVLRVGEPITSPKVLSLTVVAKHEEDEALRKRLYEEKELRIRQQVREGLYPDKHPPIRGELVQVHFMDVGWLEARVTERDAVDENTGVPDYLYSVQILAMYPFHPCCSLGGILHTKVPWARVRRKKNRHEVGDIVEVALSGGHVGMEGWAFARVVKVRGEAKRFEYQIAILPFQKSGHSDTPIDVPEWVSAKELREPLRPLVSMEIGLRRDVVGGSHLWKQCRVASCTADGKLYKLLDGHPYVLRTDLRQSYPSLSYAVFHDIWMRASRNGEPPTQRSLRNAVESAPEVKELRALPSEVRKSMATETDIDGMLQEFTSGTRPVPWDDFQLSIFRHTRPDPPPAPAVGPARVLERSLNEAVQDDETASCTSAVSGPWAKRRVPRWIRKAAKDDGSPGSDTMRYHWWSLLCLAAVAASVLVVFVIMLLPAWRKGYFPPPHGDRPIHVGLYSIEVPYPEERNHAYEGLQHLFHPSKTFRDWDRWPGEVGVDWDKDDVQRFRNAGAVTLVFDCIGVIIGGLAIDLWVKTVRMYFPIAVLGSGLAFAVSAFTYHMVLDINVAEDHPLLGHRSHYGYSFVVVTTLGVVELLLGCSLMFLQLRIITTSPAAAPRLVKQEDRPRCRSCAKEIQSCLCGTGMCNCEMCKAVKAMVRSCSPAAPAIASTAPHTKALPDSDDVSEARDTCGTASLPKPADMKGGMLHRVVLIPLRDETVEDAHHLRNIIQKSLPFTKLRLVEPNGDDHAERVLKAVKWVKACKGLRLLLVTGWMGTSEADCKLVQGIGDTWDAGPKDNETPLVVLWKGKELAHFDCGHVLTVPRDSPRVFQSRGRRPHPPVISLPPLPTVFIQYTDMESLATTLLSAPETFTEFLLASKPSQSVSMITSNYPIDPLDPFPSLLSNVGEAGDGVVTDDLASSTTAKTQPMQSAQLPPPPQPPRIPPPLQPPQLPPPSQPPKIPPPTQPPQIPTSSPPPQPEQEATQADKMPAAQPPKIPPPSQ